MARKTLYHDSDNGTAMQPQPLLLNASAPQFSPLPATDGKNYSLSDFDSSQILIVVFSCNHCPTVQAYEDRMIALQHEYARKGVQMIAISSNDVVKYPEDNFEEMVKRSHRKDFPFTYLWDEDQSVAKIFGASHTPEFFVFDKERTLVYHGRFDDNRDEPGKVKEQYVRDAVEALLAGKPVAQAETYSIGCTIKWKT